MKPVRMKDIAEALGVDASTVSLALRGDGRVAEATRAAVEAAAERMGYRRDPALSALAESRWRSGLRAGLGNWAVMSEAGEDNLRRGRYRALFGLAEKRGYNLTVVRLERDVSALRVNREMKARGVRGVILLPIGDDALAQSFAWLELDWSAFSWVALYEARYAPPVHRVVFNPFRDTRVALRAMVARGWRRIAFVHEASRLSRVNVRQHAAGLQFAAENPDVDLRMVEVGSGETVGGRGKPNALLLGYTGLRARLPDSWQALPWATLGKLQREKTVAGIFLDQDSLCAEAADLLDFLCRRRETGIPERRKTVLLDSEWMDGESLGEL